jgi:antitoxin CcdA
MAESEEPRERLTTLSLRADVVEQAEAQGLDLREIAERALRRAIAARREAQWLEEHRGAIESSNRYVEQNGLPLGKYRMF